MKNSASDAIMGPDGLRARYFSRGGCLRWLVLALLLVPSMAGATTRPADFAYGRPLTLKGNGAVHRLGLPADVYRNVARDDLGDIRIFNGAGEPVPHILRRPPNTGEAQETQEKLPLFPLFRDKKQAEQDGLAVHVRKGPDGTIIDVISAAAKPGQERQLAGYIVDASRHEGPIHQLDITWQAAEENVVTTVAVEFSHDLAHWSARVPRATLARMRFGGHEISRNRIELPAGRFRYLRLTWPAGSRALTVQAVRAVQRHGGPERTRSWSALAGQAGEADKGLTAYEYDSAARLPVDRVRLWFDEKNTLVKATLFSRPTREAQWRRHKSGLFYNLVFDRTSLVQDTLEVGSSPDRHWRVELTGAASGTPDESPRLELGWLPHELLFVARGPGPFLLAYGSARLDEEDLVQDALLAQVMGTDQEALLAEAGLGPRTVLGGPQRLNAPPPPLPWHKWLLWAVLVLGVAIIARMALVMARGIDRQE